MSIFSTQIMDIVRQAVDQQFNGNVSQASRAWGITGDNLHKWLRGDRIPTLEKISPILDALDVSITFPGSEALSRDVCFVSARPSQPIEGKPQPQAGDYIAAPLIGEVGAGPGYLPQEEVKSWFLLYKYQPAVMYRRNLIAVEIGPSSTSMQPTLNPGDIVLVDRDDRDVSTPGHMMLVLDPLDGAGMIKRVAVVQIARQDFQITYYSDNTSQFPPSVYSLQEDFGGDWEKVIVGRVVWAWADVRQK